MSLERSTQLESNPKFLKAGQAMAEDLRANPKALETAKRTPEGQAMVQRTSKIAKSKQARAALENSFQQLRAKYSNGGELLRDPVYHEVSKLNKALGYSKQPLRLLEAMNAKANQAQGEPVPKAKYPPQQEQLLGPERSTATPVEKRTPRPEEVGTLTDINDPVSQKFGMNAQVITPSTRAGEPAEHVPFYIQPYNIGRMFNLASQRFNQLRAGIKAGDQSSFHTAGIILRELRSRKAVADNRKGYQNLLGPKYDNIRQMFNRAIGAYDKMYKSAAPSIVKPKGFQELSDISKDLDTKNVLKGLQNFPDRNVALKAQEVQQGMALINSEWSQIKAQKAFIDKFEEKFPDVMDATDIDQMIKTTDHQDQLDRLQAVADTGTQQGFKLRAESDQALADQDFFGNSEVQPVLDMDEDLLGELSQHILSNLDNAPEVKSFIDKMVAQKILDEDINIDTSELSKLSDKDIQEAFDFIFELVPDIDPALAKESLRSIRIRWITEVPTSSS